MDGKADCLFAEEPELGKQMRLLLSRALLGLAGGWVVAITKVSLVRLVLPHLSILRFG